MTTVAFRDGIIAADTLMTASETRCGYCTKIMRVGRLVIGFCGTLSNFEKFRCWIKDGALGAFKSDGGNVFIVPPTGPAVIWGDSDSPWREDAEFWAIGTGEKLAMGAMAAGATAAEAVKAAIGFDVFSGGQITVLDTRPGAGTNPTRN